MKKLDWNNPPEQIRLVVNLQEQKNTYVQDTSTSESLKIANSIFKVFSAGSNLVNLTDIQKGLSLRYQKIDGFSKYIKDEKGKELLVRDLTYRLME